jgi:hypothetical protein
VVEERAFVSWSDDRYGAFTPFLRVYDAATDALGPEVQVPTGQPADVTSVNRVSLDAERVGAEVHVHLAFDAVIQPPGGPPSFQLGLATSIDGGASFLPPLVLPLPAPPPSPYSPYPLLVQAEAGVVHVMWLDQRKGMQTAQQQVFYQRSSDGGLTFDFPADRQLTDVPYVLSFGFDARGSTLAFAVDQAFSSDHYPGFDINDVSAGVSIDGGTTFGPVQSVPLPIPFTLNGFTPAVAVGAGGEVLLAWEEGFSPSIFLSRTGDGGATWSSEVEIAAFPAETPALVAAGPKRERAVLAWRGVGGMPNARLSSDGGATWGPAVELGGPMDTSWPQLAFNDRYQNLIAGWLGEHSPSPFFAGGFRPQTLTPSGFTAGATQVGAAFERFDDGSPLAFFLVSTAPGDLLLPFGDLRNTGLAPTPLLLTSVSLAAGPFAAGLDPAGSGALAPIPATLPAPLTLHAVGVSFDPLTLGFGDLSDVVRIDL